MLWGLKTVAWFDIWSFQHLFSGMCLGYGIHLLKKKRMQPTMVYFFYYCAFFCFLAYLWEFCEFSIEQVAIKHPTIPFLREFRSSEFYWNRMGSDPLCFVTGGIIFFFYNKIKWYCLFLLFGWCVCYFFSKYFF